MQAGGTGALEPGSRRPLSRLSPRSGTVNPWGSVTPPRPFLFHLLLLGLMETSCLCGALPPTPSPSRLSHGCVLFSELTPLLTCRSNRH